MSLFSSRDLALRDLEGEMDVLISRLARTLFGADIVCEEQLGQM